MNTTITESEAGPTCPYCNHVHDPRWGWLCLDDKKSVTQKCLQCGTSFYYRVDNVTKWIAIPLEYIVSETELDDILTQDVQRYVDEAEQSLRDNIERELWDCTTSDGIE